MDKCIVDVEQESNMREKSLATSASKCSGSLIRINSIAIDISCPPEEEIGSPKHEHFSIRGFVSETMKKDKKKCMPFASEVNDDDDNNINLRPISAPEFRRWQCSKRVPDIANQKSAPAMILADKSDAGTSSEKHSGEKHNFLTHSIQNIGDDEHGSRGPKDVDYNHPNDKLLGFNPQCTNGHKDVMNNIEHACVTDKANPIQIETHSTNTPADEPENVSSGSDEFAFRAMSHKRKPKLRSLAEIINEDKSLTTEHNLKTKSLQIEVDLNNPSQEMEANQKLIILDETDPPIITAKRSKGPVTEAEKLNNNNSNIKININKRVDILETDSEKDERPTLLDSRVSAKAQQQNKARKHKSIDLNRKPRWADTENRKTVVTNETGIVEKANVGSCFKNSSFGRQMETVSALLKGKRPAEGESGLYVPLSNKRGAGDSNFQENITGIPDLNEAYIEKPSMTDPTENMDISALSRRETVREGKRPIGSINNNSNKSHIGRFSPLTPGKYRFPPYSAPNPTASGPRSRPSEGSDLFTFDLNVALNPSIQPNGSEDRSQKKAKNMKLGEGNRAANEGCSIKSGKIGPGRYKSVPSKDAHSNEKSPTMQLLPLMDQGIALGSSFKFAPRHHQQSGRSKDLPTLMLNGVGYSKGAQMPPPPQAINSAGPSSLATQASRSYPSLEVCTLNRNPADFSIPDAKNECIMRAKELKPKKRNSSKEMSGASGNVEGSKRQRVEKDLSRKESSRK